jgi:hypothetical protein
MRRPGIKLLALAAPLLAAGATFAAPAVDPGQEAQSAQWQMVLSNTGIYCEGCCAVGSLCCSINYPCRVDAPADPAGGG